ncbi:hypothetical protein B0H17DRAFT_953721, partial [Mycena rosella]
SFTIDDHHNRSSVRDHLVRVKKSSHGRLQLALDMLATKVVMCDPGSGGSPVVYTVEIAPDAALPVASNFDGKERLETDLITARHEVIISVCVFQSPQLLSGIGDQNELSRHGIRHIVHLPTTSKVRGTPQVHYFIQGNADHDEVALIWTLKKNHTVFNGCTVLYTPKDDPCLKYWTESGHQNLYSAAGFSS